MIAEALSASRRPARPGEGALHLVERNLLVYRRQWLIITSGFIEPVLYLAGIGVGVGALVGDIDGISYARFVAPALMAAAAMNGAVYEVCFNLFFKLRYARLYETVLSTPLGVGDIALGEVTFALMRGAVYAAFFIGVMAVIGLVASPWALLAMPAAVLIGFTFAAVGMVATTYLRSWQDFDLVQLVLLPLFLFSATFYPLSRYGGALQVVVEWTPLYHGVHLIRALTTGAVAPSLLLDVAYLALLGLAGMAFAARRLDRLLLR